MQNMSRRMSDRLSGNDERVRTEHGQPPGQKSERARDMSDSMRNQERKPYITDVDPGDEEGCC